MKNKEYRCINTEGVYNITEGEIYTSPGEVCSGEGKMSIYVINDNGDVAYYDASRFVEVDTTITNNQSTNDMYDEYVSEIQCMNINGKNVIIEKDGSIRKSGGVDPIGVDKHGDVIFNNILRSNGIEYPSCINDLNGDFINDIPIIASKLNTYIKQALDSWMLYNMDQYIICKQKDTLRYTLTLTKYGYPSNTIISEENWVEFFKKMNILTNAIIYDNIKPDYEKDTYGDYIKANINN